MPLRPEDVVSKKRGTIPDYVFDAFDYLIAERWDGSSSVISQNDVISLIVQKYGEKNPTNKQLDRQKIFNKGWLDVESIYRKVGWVVEYDKPAYCETYAATFTFSKHD